MPRKARDGGSRFRWRLTPAGLILLAAFVVLITLAFVAPSTPVYAGLALVVLIWGIALNSNFPSQSIGRSPRAAREFADRLRESDTDQGSRR